ncbi:Serine/threonine protein kinase [Giardia duodenalis assemblage B]|uniref:Serine/threonine protein kinase n=1 Tax=Giardia duodenalis assemblage B TaxID=1394984 RepID=A0A132NMI9_GIAIN|nr:Serine/threonine protein kinase [Giardia intestinalis assemblage B]
MAGFSLLDVENAKLWALLKTDRALNYTQQHDPPHQTVLLSGTSRAQLFGQMCTATQPPGGLTRSCSLKQPVPARHHGAARTFSGHFYRPQRACSSPPGSPSPTGLRRYPSL